MTLVSPKLEDSADREAMEEGLRGKGTSWSKVLLRGKMRATAQGCRLGGGLVQNGT